MRISFIILLGLVLLQLVASSNVLFQRLEHHRVKRGGRPIPGCSGTTCMRGKREAEPQEWPVWRR